MVQQVVYNTCFGGFGVHENVVQWVRDNESALLKQYDIEDATEIADSTISGELYADGSGRKPEHMNYIADSQVSRDNELLASIVAEEATYDGLYNCSHSSLRVAEVPDGVSWTIDQHDGKETVRESARTFS